MEPSDARPRWALPALCLLLAVLSCPFVSAVPGVLLDDSWGFAVHAWASGSNGHVPPQYFTYGPLGFLVVPVRWHGSTYAASVLFVLAVQTALCAAVLARLRRLVSFWPAVALTVVLASLTGPFPSENLVVVGTLIAVELLQRGAVHHGRLVLAAGCVAAGTDLLVKFSTGLASLVLVAVVTTVLTSGPWLRRLAAGAGSVVASLAVSWVLFGIVSGRPGAFPTWLHASREIASGYTGMGLEIARAGRQRDYVLGLVILGVLAFLVLLIAALRRDVTGIASALLVCMTGYLAFREGLTRHDQLHTSILVSALLLLPLGLLLRQQARWLVVPLVMSAVLMGMYQLHTTVLHKQLNLVSNAERVVNRLHVIVSPGDVVKQGKHDVQAHFQMPLQVQAALRGHRVSVDNYDTALVWGYDLHWGTDAVWAGYSSYTPWLDAKKAASLSGPEAPDRIVRYRLTPAIDGRYAQFESPQYQLAVQCDWHAVLVSGPWQVLAPGPSRCGTAKPLNRTSFQAGQAIQVPKPRDPHGFVTVRLDLHAPASDKLEALLFKPLTQRYVLLNGTRYRLMVATAVGPLVLRMPADAVGTPNRFTPNDITTLALPFAGSARFEEIDPR